MLLWAPGIGVAVHGDKMLSPYELLILLLLPAIAISSLNRRGLMFGMISLAICTASYMYSLDRSASGVYLLYYCLIIIPHMLFFLQIFEDDQATRAFCIGFVRTGVWMGPVAMLQFLSPIQITLINNTDYSLQIGLHRAQLFAPEASILAALYVIAICLAIYNTFAKIEPQIPGGVASYTSMVAGLVSTISTSAFTVLPPLILMIFRLCGVPWKILLRYVIAGAVLLIAFYVVVYGARVSGGDSTSSSLLRLASMAAGAQMILQHWATGLGLGMNKNIADAVKIIYATWSHDVVEKPGIDSFQLALMVEMGVIPGLISIALLVICYRHLKAKTHTPRTSMSLVAMLSICVWFVSLLTSGYRGLAYCWLFFPAGYVIYLARKRNPEHRMHDPATELAVSKS